MDTWFTGKSGIVLGVLLAIIVLLVLVIWSIRRHRNPVLEFECGKPIETMLPSIAGLSLGAVVEGNHVEIFENGRLFDVLIDEIDAAQFSVHFETFLWKEGVLGQRLADAFCRRARAGVQVRLMLDANGSRGIGKAAEQQLKDAGCNLRYFHRTRIRHIGVFNNRTHRKICVIDGRVAFAGGHCIVDSWLGDAQDKEHFADVSLRVRGPIVSHLQSVFSENWVGHTGELFVGPDVFPALKAEGDVPMHVAFVKPEGSAPAVKILHHALICFANKRLWIQNPYFIPEPEAIAAFAQAVKRGVDVRVMMPSTGGSDNPMVQHAGHYVFDKLLRAGVRLFEYPHTLLHQKVIVVDSIWSSVGSCNFDDRSFEINDEVTLGLLDADLARQLEGIFEKYVRECREITQESWRRRGVKERLIERLAYSINELL
ncbi:MAG TPA: phospholipase D-like domain-containing protein [Burkholderiaceae bacterium]|nr:phospholipase D-like domain-containing protein [Burkholderiaceae bacterium]